VQRAEVDVNSTEQSCRLGHTEFYPRCGTLSPRALPQMKNSASAWFQRISIGCGLARFYEAHNETAAGGDEEESTLVSGC
jgi:hypothetical protein